MKHYHFGVGAIAISALTGCATAKLDINVDIFEKMPAVEQPLTARKVEEMLQDLGQLQAAADRTIKLKTELASTSVRLFEDAMLLLDTDSLKVEAPTCPQYSFTVSKPDSTEHTPEAKATKVDEEMLRNLEKPHDFRELSSLAQYERCLKKEYDHFQDRYQIAKNALKSYLQAYKMAYNAEVTLLCNRQGWLETDCFEYFEETSVVTSARRGHPKHRRETRYETELIKQPYIVDHTAVMSRLRNYCFSAASMEFESYQPSYLAASHSPYVMSACKSSEDFIPFVVFEVATLDKVADVVSAYKRISAPSLYVNWVGLEHLLNAQIAYLSLKERRQTLELWKRFGRNLQREILALYHRTGLSTQGQHRTLSRAFDDTSIQGSSLKLANELEALRNDLPETASSQAALAGLVKNKSALNDVIDRLQNAGDPVWRMITDASHDAKWNNINKLSFKADGETSIVVIRDNPTRFRTSQAQNNPAVLAQNQLIISRALTDAAIDTVGALSGVPLPQISNTQDNAPVIDQSAQSQTRSDKAVVTEINFQKQTIANLSKELSALLAEIDSVDKASVDELQRLKSKASTTLKAYSDALSIYGAQQ